MAEAKETKKKKKYNRSGKLATYKVGTMVEFPKIRDAINPHMMREAIGEVIGHVTSDNGNKFIEVEFKDSKNPPQLQRSIRRFVVEEKKSSEKS
jgi:hypothetical protein